MRCCWLFFIPIIGYDVFVNLVGGLRLSETAGDLAVVLAVVSSFKDKPIPHHWVVFGELGLNGEVRPVQNGEERLREAAKHGFTFALAPHKNITREGQQGLEVIPVKTLGEAIAIL